MYLVGCHECHVTNNNLFDTTKASGKTTWAPRSMLRMTLEDT
jgi:hypothetical protein